MTEDNFPTPTDAPEFVPPMTETEFYATLENFDPVADLPVWQGLDKLNNPLPDAPPITLEAFGPEQREEIMTRASEISPANRDAAISQAISEKLNREAINLRVRSTSDDASHYVREHCALEYELVEAEKQTRAIYAQLDAKRTITDPATGKVVETEDFQIEGERRTALLLKANELWGRSQSLAEREGPKRLQEAKQRDWSEYTELHRRTWELGEIDRRAHKMVQDERLNTQAAARAKHLKGSR